MKIFLVSLLTTTLCSALPKGGSPKGLNRLVNQLQNAQLFNTIALQNQIGQQQGVINAFGLQPAGVPLIVNTQLVPSIQVPQNYNMQLAVNTPFVQQGQPQFQTFNYQTATPFQAQAQAQFQNF
jgi:hypothetical protein